MSLRRALLAMATAPGAGEVHVANPREKRAALALERDGLITIRRTDDRCAGHREWWIRACDVTSNPKET